MKSPLMQAQMNKPLSIYIVEDMAFARFSLEGALKAKGFGIAGSVSTAEKAWEEMPEKKIDLALLDINLAGKMNGIWLAKRIRKFLNIPIVYITAYGDEQTLEEIEGTRPDGFLMKPYDETTLVTTLKIAVANFSRNKNQRNAELDHHFHLIVEDGGKKVKLFSADIEYLQSDGNYVKIVLEHKSHLVRGKILDLVDKLPKDEFIQIHNRYVVNRSKIVLITKSSLQTSKNELPISRKYQKLLHGSFGK